MPPPFFLKIHKSFSLLGFLAIFQHHKRCFSQCILIALCSLNSSAALYYGLGCLFGFCLSKNGYEGKEHIGWGFFSHVEMEGGNEATASWSVKLNTCITLLASWYGSLNNPSSFEQPYAGCLVTRFEQSNADPRMQDRTQILSSAFWWKH